MDELEDLTLPQGQSPVIDSVKAAVSAMQRRNAEGVRYALSLVRIVPMQSTEYSTSTGERMFAH